MTGFAMGNRLANHALDPWTVLADATQARAQTLDGYLGGIEQFASGVNCE